MSDPKGTEPPRSPLQVLLVEDERGSAVYLEGLLQDVAPGQFELSWAPTLSAGFDQLHARRFDAILLDLSLPDSSGLETVRRMTGTGIGIPIVVITGHADERVAVEALRAGAQDYLVKDDASGRTVARAIRHAIERKQSEEALRRARDELERRVQDRTAELSRAIADLREEVVRRGEAEGELRERTDQLRQLASQVTLAEQRERQRLALLIHDGLQQLLVGATYRLGRLERSASHEVRQASEEVGALISEAISASRSLTAELGPPILLRSGGLGPALEWLSRWMRDKQGLEVRVTVDPGVEPGAEDLTILLFQAARELLFNVVKHAGVKAAEVQLTRQGSEVRLTVSDTGSGFDPSVLARGGSRDGGFGLFSIRERLDLLGGRLEAESTLGRGSRLTLVAPMAPRPETPKASRAPAGGAPPAASSPQPAPRREGVRIRVMLVDDHPVMRQGLAALLRGEPDVEVVGEASDGQAAVDLARQLRPDVVLMDINLPVMNGIEATRAIHGELPGTRIVGLSMFQEAEQAALMREAGAAYYLTKSGPSRELIATIRACGAHEASLR